MLVDTKPLKWIKLEYDNFSARKIFLEPPGLEVKRLFSRYVEIKEAALAAWYPTTAVRPIEVWQGRNWRACEDMKLIINL